MAPVSLDPGLGTQTDRAATAIAIAEGFDLRTPVARFRLETGASEEWAAACASELVRYLALSATSPSGLPYPMVGPADGVDALWHTFLIHTEQYADFCAQVAGRFLHHTPLSPGETPDPRLQERLDAGYREFLDRYEELIGHPAPGRFWPRRVDPALLFGAQPG